MIHVRGARRPLVALAGAALVVVASLVGAQPAFAHASLVTSDPPDGAVLEVAPTSVRVTFSEAVSPDAVVLTLTAAGGGPIDIGAPQLDASRRELSATLPPLADAAYRLTYRVRDPVDLHLTGGSIVFGVGKGTTVTAAGTSDNAPEWFDVLLRWLERLAAAIVLGGIALALLVVPRTGVNDVVSRMRAVLGVVACGAIALLLVDLAQLLRDVHDVGVGFASIGRVLLYSSFGRRELVVGQAAIGTLVAANLLRQTINERVARRWADRRFDLFAGVLVALALLLTGAMAWSAHASVGGRFVFGYVLRFAHLGGLGVWAGGLIVLATLWVLGRVPSPAATLASFSPVAAASLAVVVVSGLGLSAREVVTVTALLSTWFGGALLIKLGLVALALAVALAQRRAVRRGRSSEARTILEAVVAVAIVLGGAFLSASAPAVGARFAAAGTGLEEATRTVVAEGLTISIDIQPNRPGPNDVRITVLDPRRPSPNVVTGAGVRLAGAPTTGEDRSGAATANKAVDLGQVQLTAAGALSVTASVTRQGREPLVLDVPWVVNGAPVTRVKTVLSDARLGGWAAGAAVALGLLSLAGALLGRFRRPRSA